MVLRAELKEHQLSYPTIRSQNFEASQVEKEVVWNFLPVFPQILFWKCVCINLISWSRDYSHVFWANHKSSASPEVRMIPHTSIRLIAFAMDHKQTVVTCSNSSSWVIWGKAFGCQKVKLKPKKTNHCGSSEAQTKIQLEFKVGSKQQAPHPKNITWKPTNQRMVLTWLALNLLPNSA